MKVKLVTSFNKRIYDEYAKKSLQTWCDYLALDEGSVIEVWINGEFPKELPKFTTNKTPFKYRMLDTQSEGWTYFYETFSNFPRPQTPPGQEFRFNFLPFSCKVYALAESANEVIENKEDFDVFIWLDADVVLKKVFGSSALEEILGESNFAWLDRGRPWAHGETGFMAARNKNDALDLFLNTANIYGSGALFYHAEWHDAFIYTAQIRLKEFTDSDFKVRNLNTDRKNEFEKGLFPFKTSILNNWMDHWKGPRKDNIGGQLNANN